jgi:predicted HTH domain antitoxin
MNIKLLHVEIPPELRACLGSEEEATHEVHQALVMDLLRQGKLSRAKAAELLHVPLEEFPNLLSQYRIPWFDATLKDLEEDEKTLENQETSPR